MVQPFFLLLSQIRISCVLFSKFFTRVPFSFLLWLTLFLLNRFVRCQGIQFAQPVVREKPQVPGHVYLWGNKGLHAAANAIFGQYNGTCIWLFLVSF